MALIRVKRRLQDDPIDLVVLSCKKPKTEESPVTKLFKFATTVDEQDGDIKKHISEVNSLKRQPLKCREQNVSAITEKLRTESRLSSHNNRLKVVNWFRTVGEDGKTVGDDETYTIVDLINIDGTVTSSKNTDPVIDLNIEKAPPQPLTEEQYVYDLYYSAVGGDIDDLQIENLLSVHAVNEDLIFGDYSEESSEFTESEDDSNDENNWRNDYPDEMSNADEDSSSSINETMMRNAMNRINIDGDSLSSDEDLINSSEEDPYYFLDHVSDDDYYLGPKEYYNECESSD